MKNSIVAILAVAAIWAGIWPAVSAENSIVGTWLLTSFSLTVLDTKETSHPYGDHPTGYIQYTPGGHMVMFLTAGELKLPAAGSYTDTERADVHRAIVGAYAGTYVAEGNKVSYHVLTSWRPEWIGHEQIRYFEISRPPEAKKPCMTTPPQVPTGRHSSLVVDHVCGPPRFFEKLRVRGL